MRILLSKKTIFFSLLILFFSISFFLFSLYINSKNQEDGFNKVIDYCRSVEKGKKCVLLLKNEFFKGEDTNKRCFIGRIPVVTEDNTNEEISFCIPTNLLKWTNPYSDYDSFVPVNVILVRNGVLGLIFRNYYREVEMELIDDTELGDIIKNIKFSSEEEIIGIKSKKQTELDIKGYYLSTLYIENIEQKYFTIHNATVKSFYVDLKNNNNITFETTLNGLTKEFSIVKDSFYFVKNHMEKDLISISSFNISDYIPKDKPCRLYFSSPINKAFDEENLEEYIDGIVGKTNPENKPLFKLLVCIEETPNVKD